MNCPVCHSEKVNGKTLVVETVPTEIPNAGPTVWTLGVWYECRGCHHRWMPSKDDRVDILKCVAQVQKTLDGVRVGAGDKAPTTSEAWWAYQETMPQPEDLLDEYYRSLAKDAWDAAVRAAKAKEGR